ncbi:RagB/SusD family nutrient uptake outer membrane protein [Hymenobacter monticola]|uniref:RagB/SusD family nutrient uptake outer membrane protein n=1 Tax=Hymenobacter monticola TaxID=1705399 RepID=A0ABY4B9K3_9BACT|nr:RagB/SusD family nutrient uptake outer membrane protein [Hymenobacter monticola]UOE35817.1 RagB/SusD family nutrient uptake outer membrane protein [Hymenobacter monticola]
MKSFHAIGRAVLAAAALAGTAGLVSSCKDYLEVEPVALNTTEYTFSTVSGATAAIIGAYDPLSGDYGYGQRVSLYFPLDSDELIGSAGAPADPRRQIARYAVQTNNDDVVRSWNQLYQGVERANICIDQIPKMALYTSGTATDIAALRRLHGEALTLRAQYLFELVRNWGNVPVQFTPAVSGQNFNLPNSDSNTTLERLVADLLQAQDLLPWRSQAGPANERITKGAAKALRARIALYRGGYSSQNGQMVRANDYLNYYRIARQECADLMTVDARREHNLNPSFLETFKSMNELRPEAANELIFQVGMATATGASGSKLGYYNGPRLQNQSSIYGSSQGGVTIVPTYFYAFDSTDTRRDVTITTYGMATSGTVQIGVALTSAADGKWRRDWHNPPVTGTVNYLDYNWPIIRYADVLLMFAETENELNGPTQLAQDALMEVRSRGFGGNRALATAALTRAGFSLGSKASFFEALVNERYLEFGGEGIRKYDLLRWNLFETKINEAKANIEKMALGQAPYDKVPLYQFYRTPTGPSLAVQPVQWLRSFYKPTPTALLPTTPATPLPAGYNLVNWRQSINAAYVANTKPAGTVYTLPGATTPQTSVGSGLAAQYVPGRGKELLPIPQATINADPALKQNFGY